MSNIITVGFQILDSEGIAYADYNEVKQYVNNAGFEIIRYEYSLMGECWFMEVQGMLKDGFKSIDLTNHHGSDFRIAGMKTV